MNRMALSPAVFFVLLTAISSLQAFDRHAYFNKSIYQRTEYHLVQSACAGFEWDYAYGFGRDNAAVGMAGMEFSWRKNAAAAGLGWFPKLRFMFNHELESDYSLYRYEGFRYLRLRPRIGTGPSAKTLDFPMPNPELTFNVFWRYDLKLPFLDSIQPVIGAGLGAQTRSWYTARFVPSAGADVNTSVENNFYYSILALGAELTMVPDLCEFQVNCRFAFGSMVPGGSSGSSGGLSTSVFHTSLMLTLAMNFYLF